MPRRALALVVLSLFAVAFAVASLRGEGSGAEDVAEVRAPRPPKPIVAPSGAVAIEGPRSADAGLVPMALPAVAAMAQAQDAAVHAVPVDPSTGKPLEPARVQEGSAAGSSIPVPRRVRDRGVITN